MTRMPIRDVSLFVKVLGQGPPLLLMHGGPGLDHTTMLPFRAAAEHFTLVFYDHRCNGRSTGADVSSMSFANLTADADALRQRLGFERWAVLGHSFGGMVAIEYALRYPQRLSHLILLDTCGDAWWVQQHAPEILAKRGYAAKTVQAARCFFNGRLKPREVLPIGFKLARAYVYRFSLPGLVRDIVRGPHPKMRPESHIFGFRRLLSGWSVMDRLNEISAPTLVLAGRHDFQFPPEHQAILADRIPHARLELIEQAGHNAHAERPDEVLAALQGFLGAGCAAAAVTT